MRMNGRNPVKNSEYLIVSSIWGRNSPADPWCYVVTRNFDRFDSILLAFLSLNLFDRLNYEGEIKVQFASGRCAQLANAVLILVT